MADETTTDAAPAESVSAEEAPAPQAPDVSEQLQGIRSEFERSLDQRFDEFAERIAPEEEGLLGYDEQGNPVYEDEEENFDPEEMDPQEALLHLMDQRAEAKAQEALATVAQQREWDRRTEELHDLAERHPDIREEQMMDAIAQRLAPAARQYGDGVYSDPELVKTAYDAIKADQVSAAEVPAEEASRAGAALETGAGPGKAQSVSETDQIKREILGAGHGSGNWV